MTLFALAPVDRLEQTAVEQWMADQLNAARHYPRGQPQPGKSESGCLT